MIEMGTAFREAVRADVRRTHIKIEAVTESPDLNYEETTSSGAMAFSDELSLNDGSETILRYATLEPGRWLLDGSFDVVPDAETVSDAGFVLAEISGTDGIFSAPQTVSREFSGATVLRAVSLWFSADEADGNADTFTLTLYREGEIVFEKTVVGNSASSVVIGGINAARPTGIQISITKWSLPFRRARIAEIMLGEKKIWTEDDLTGFSVKHQTDISCQSLPYGVCEITIYDETGAFDPRNEYGIFDTLEDKQSVKVSLGVDCANGKTEYVPLGVFYQYNNGWKTNTFTKLIKWRLVDIIGLLAERDFRGTYVTVPTFSGWVSALLSRLGEAFRDRFYIAPEYADMPLTASGGGYSTCGDLLLALCLATGTFPRADAMTGKLCIEPLGQSGGEDGLNDFVTYPTYEANEEVASVTVRWLEDDDELSYTLRGNSASATQNISFFSPFVKSEAVAKAVAERVLSAYGGTKYELHGRGDPSREIGDVDTIRLEGNAGTIVGRRIYQDFSYDEGVLQNCKSKLLRANGIFIFTTRLEFTEDGSFTVPDGVEMLKIILVGGGVGGAYGRGVITVGKGAYVYEADINVSAGDTFAVTIGAGGAAGETAGEEGGATTFGAYSSLMGERYSDRPNIPGERGRSYPVAYNDIASGKAYAMRGSLRQPEDGTGNGGYWQYSGASGAAIIYYREADSDA